jgi:hypothetical protein
MSIVTVTIPFPGGTATMADSTAQAIIAQTLTLSGLLSKQILFMEQNVGLLGLKTPGTFINQLNVVADSLNDTTIILSEILEGQKELIAQLGGLQTSLNAVQGQIASGVTTQQLAVADQIKSNKFQQLNTNAALDRAELPPVEVKPDDMATSITTAVQDVGAIKLQATAAQLVESNISAGIAWTATQANNIISQSFVGKAAAGAKTAIKGFLGIVDPEVVKLQVATKAKKRATKSLNEPVIEEK